MDIDNQCKRCYFEYAEGDPEKAFHKYVNLGHTVSQEIVGVEPICPQCLSSLRTGKSIWPSKF